MPYTSVEEIFSQIENKFNPDRAKGLSAVFQFNITGDGGGKWHVIVDQGKCTVHSGTHATPNVTLTMDAPTWVGMVNGEVSGIQAFMSGKLFVNGDLNLAQSIQDLFK
jgi:putative sterol carrier protein